MTEIYKTGTATVTNGSATVTGTGTAWAVALVTGGLFIKDGVSEAIESVTDDDTLVLANVWAGASDTGVYSIMRENSAAASVVNLLQKLTDATITLSLHSLHPNFVGTLAEIDALELAPEDTEFVAARLESGAPAEYYRWSGTNWIGPFPIGTPGSPGIGVGGYGLPVGGLTGQTLEKASGSDGDAAWVDAKGYNFSVLTADRAGSDVNTAQAVFGSGEDALTVEALTSYRFKASIIISRAAGTTSHTTGFLLAGTATFTSIDALAKVSNPTGNILGAVSEIQISAASETVLTAANTAATENVRISIEGVMRINGAGTVIPQFKFSAAPGGAPTVKRNSFFEARKIGSNTVAAAGAWA